MRKLYLYVGLGLAIMTIAPSTKAQDTGPCDELVSENAPCTCNGIHNTVFVQNCGNPSDFHCSPSIRVACCLNPLITFLTHTEGNACNGPRVLSALKGLPEGQQVYIRNCKGLYIAVLVHHSEATASGD